MSRRLTAPALLLGLGLAATTALSACSGTGSSSSAAARADGRLAVVASFYPLQYAVQQIGGEHVTVTSLTKPGAEPHDVELTPQDVASVSTASLVVYEKSFQPAVDEAVAQEGQGHAFDVAPTADLTLAAPAEDGEAPAAGAKDPHFWLDPQRYAAVAKALGARLAELDPAHAASYGSATSAFVAKLSALDTAFREGTRTCERRQLVTSHAAFGYLSQRYGFTQVPITGLDPEVEPSAQDLARVADFVRANEVTTIYAETLVEPKFADTVARSTGATVATLDPLEGLTSASKGSDYLEVMRSNLTALRAGQSCS
ncbi:metal ABC transporter substrate-binding protein [Lapillicoccus jejuensis]|uniref:Zinc transport system substrate-binding protein n=1 Tax=Lapillicoccus jejuensis TaxID=402171 RepID=A0A542E677_9MICO|nr:metal ABC transporter substrate-binding protein [Lapillicoccus jejuensis]TQJ10814.1 zinc transport system substrate-binding protein [Lapillicoccus jejuensis]